MKRIVFIFLITFPFIFSCDDRGLTNVETGDGPIQITDVGTDDIGNAPRFSRLKASGKRIVDTKGNPVRLRGFNIGGYLFLETWVNQIDHTTSSRAYHFAQNHKYKDQIIAALKESIPEAKKGDPLPNVCIGNSDGWLENFATELKKLIPEPDANEFINELKKYPSICDDSDYKLRRLLAKRFGLETRDELILSFIKSWITESDIKWISEQGFNLIRIPIGYRTLTTDEDTELPEKLTYNEPVFKAIDELLNWCEKYGVYAIIDLQESPGGHNDYSDFKGKLYENEKMQKLTVELWKYISSRYKNRDIVAMYSLLAEPFDAPSSDARDIVYDKIVKGIRENGDDHLLVIHDGFRGMGSLPMPEKYNWSNVVYSTHIFEFDATSLEAYKMIIGLYDKVYTEAQRRYNVPFFIGSFSVIKDVEWAYAALSELLNWYEKKQYHWSLWTYKRIDSPEAKILFNHSSMWGVRSVLRSEFRRPDIYLDSKEEIKQKFEDYKNLVLEPNQRMLDILKSFQK
ncbi:MAG: cellulase family glycosylhydrolase [Deltaproteobacteria bacterium]|nr:cellulase family glycosylhydrolase [Deltaproteobacteria bacterium]